MAGFPKLLGRLKPYSLFGKGGASEPAELLVAGLARAAKTVKAFPFTTRKSDIAGLDEFFFSRTPLAPGGKEYWFIHATSTAGDKAQLVLTFGSSFFSTSVNGKPATGGKVAAVGWYWSGGKKVFLEESTRLEAGNGRLRTKAFEFSGAFPDFVLSAGKGTRLRFSKPKSGVPYEALSASANSLGIGMYNLYLDAGGKVGGKKFRGFAYVQKVVVSAPFVPWNWLRLTFPDKSVVDFFAVRPDQRDAGVYLFRSAVFRNKSGRVSSMGECRLKRLAKDRWVLEGGGVAAYLKTYASKPFLIKGQGEFHYDEHFVECTDFVFGKYKAKSGLGLIEDAYGFLL